MKRTLWVLLGLLVFVVPAPASAFCGFYVGSAGSTLYNDATQVVLLRSGTKTVISMQNDYRGPTEGFAMVVPVPEVLQEENVKTLDKKLFDKVDELSAPRLVEYWEQDPCVAPPQEKPAYSGGGRGGSGYGKGAGNLGGGTVTVEAEFAVGEYDIVILSTDQARALETWLKRNDYAIPEGAAPYFRPYVEDGSYFFVAKVDPQRAKFDDGRAVLSPLRFHYTDEQFRLPVRLGLINSSGQQDLLVYILADRQRYELANHDNVMIPTNLEVAPDVKDRFAEFYEALFSRTVEENPGAFVTEYAWSVGPGKCDPCPAQATGLDASELFTLGADVTGNAASASYMAVPVGPPEVSGGDLQPEIIRRVLRMRRRELQWCLNEKIEQRFPQGTVEFRIDADGQAKTSDVSVGGEANGALAACIREKVDRWVFPGPKDKKPVEVAWGFRARMMSSGDMSGWSLTRIHGRYDRESLGEDLVFRKAEPIVGGREHQGENRFGPNPAGTNTYQGRYIIRHEWDGPVECESPQFGRWGGPPSGGTPKVKPAASRNTTGETPKPLELGGVVRKAPWVDDTASGKEDRPTDQRAADEETPKEADGVEPSGSCKCSTARGPSFPGLLLIGLMVFGVVLRRRVIPS